jgi:rod shape-determining protein MreC
MYTPLRRLLLVLIVRCFDRSSCFWRIDSPRVERSRALVDRVVPGMDWAMAPVTGAINDGAISSPTRGW